MPHESLIVEGAPPAPSAGNPPRPVFCHAVKANGLIFIAGQAPVDASGRIVDGDFVTQARQVFDNIERVAAGAGTNLRQTMRVAVYLRDMSDFAAMNDMYTEYFTDPTHVRTTIQSDLPFGIEIDAVFSEPE